MSHFGTNVTLIYAALDRYGNPVSDEAKHTLALVQNGTVKPITQPSHALPFHGFYAVDVGGQDVSFHSLHLLGTTATEGVRLQFFPSLHPLMLPAVTPGKEGGLLLCGKADGAINAKQGSVAVHSLEKRAINAESFSKGAITPGSLADKIISADKLADQMLSPKLLSPEFAKAVCQLLFGNDQPLNTQEGHVRLVVGDKPGELQIEKGAVTTRQVNDKSGYSLSPDQTKAINEAITGIASSLKTHLESLATAGHFQESLSRQDERTTDALKQLADFGQSLQSLAQSFQGMGQSLATGVPANIVQLNGDKKSAESLSTFFGPGCKLPQSGLGTVGELAKPVKLAEGSSVPATGLLWTHGDTTVDLLPMLASLFDTADDRQTVSLNASTQSRGGTGLTEDALRSIQKTLLDLLHKEPLLSAPNQPPAEQYSVLEALSWLVTESLSPRKSSKGKEEMLSGDKRRTLATRKTTTSDAGTITSSWT